MWMGEVRKWDALVTSYIRRKGLMNGCNPKWLINPSNSAVTFSRTGVLCGRGVHGFKPGNTI